MVTFVEPPAPPATLVPSCSVDYPAAAGNRPVFDFGEPKGATILEWEVQINGQIVDRFQNNPEAWVDWGWRDAPFEGPVLVEVRGYTANQTTEWANCGMVTF